MKSLLRFRSISLALALLLIVSSAVSAAGNPMKLVGALNPWKDGQFSNVAADAARHVGYLGSFDDQGVAVIKTTDPANPVLTEILSTHIASDTSDSADLDLVGRYLAVSHQQWSGPGAFEGISVYDTQPDPYHPALLRRISIPGGVHTVQLDAEVEAGRPYAYANSAGNFKVTIVNILTGDILSQLTSSEGIGCLPSEVDCQQFSFAHEGFIQRHPDSGKVLDYVSYWDSGLRIFDVTNPSDPVEVGAFDYSPAAGTCCAHDAAATPSGDWVYVEDEIGVGGTGGVHILDTSACSGTSYCTPTQVGFWHIKGHPVQAAAFHGRGPGAFHGVIQRFFTYDAHNLDLEGENTLLVANYSMGIRLVDTTNKAAPVETSFYLPNANKNLACNQNCFFQGRETWGAYFGSDGRIYASDFWLGFFIVQPSG
ncbi:MAG TPA: hypothetical protein VJ793_21645 [Anaerolineae bacterium]|nr:hypothetical protein [Anaerolineae bacterium]